jgi:hypothetical protein
MRSLVIVSMIAATSAAAQPQISVQVDVRSPHFRVQLKQEPPPPVPLDAAVATALETAIPLFHFAAGSTGTLLKVALTDEPGSATWPTGPLKMVLELSHDGTIDGTTRPIKVLEGSQLPRLDYASSTAWLIAPLQTGVVQNWEDWKGVLGVVPVQASIVFGPERKSAKIVMDSLRRFAIVNWLRPRAVFHLETDNATWKILSCWSVKEGGGIAGPAIQDDAIELRKCGRSDATEAFTEPVHARLFLYRLWAQ